MIYQQTTQVPNSVFDLHLPTLTEAELKMLLIVIRQTNGWIDKRTGKRKTRDRISHSQFIKKTGLCRRVVSKALRSLIEKGLVSVSDSKGTCMNQAQDRKGLPCLNYSFQIEPILPKSEPFRVQGVKTIGDLLTQSSFHFLARRTD